MLTLLDVMSLFHDGTERYAPEAGSSPSQKYPPLGPPSNQGFVMYSLANIAGLARGVGNKALEYSDMEVKLR